MIYTFIGVAGELAKLLVRVAAATSCLRWVPSVLSSFFSQFIN